MGACVFRCMLLTSVIYRLFREIILIFVVFVAGLLLISSRCLAEGKEAKVWVKEVRRDTERC